MSKRMAIFGIVALALLVATCSVSRNFFGGGEQQAAVAVEPTPMVVAKAVETDTLNPTNIPLVFSQSDGGKWRLVRLEGGANRISTKTLSWGGPHLVRVSGSLATAVGEAYGWGEEPGRAVVNWTTGKPVFPMPAAVSDWAAAGAEGRQAFVLDGLDFDVLIVLPKRFSYKAHAIMSPSINSSGDIVAAVKREPNAPWQLVTFRQSYTGSEPEQLTSTPYEQAFPSFSPDGEKVVFAGRDPEGSGRWGLYIVDTQTVSFSEEGPKLYMGGDANFGDALYPVWGPDGWIAFTRCPTGVSEPDLLCGDGEIWLMKVSDPSKPATVEPIALGVAPSWLWPEWLQTAEITEPLAVVAAPTQELPTAAVSTPVPTSTPAGRRFVKVTWSRGSGLTCHSSLDTLEWNHNTVDQIPTGTVVEVFDIGHAPVAWVNPEQPDDQRTQEALLVEYLFFKCWIRSNATRDCGPGECPR